jgi:hypothetical protein
MTKKRHRLQAICASTRTLFYLTAAHPPISLRHPASGEPLSYTAPRRYRPTHGNTAGPDPICTPCRMRL